MTAFYEKIKDFQGIKVKSNQVFSCGTFNGFSSTLNTMSTKKHNIATNLYLF